MHCVQGAQVCTSGLEFLTVLATLEAEGALHTQHIYNGDADTADNTPRISAYLSSHAYLKASSIESLHSFSISVKHVGKSFALTQYIIDILL